MSQNIIKVLPESVANQIAAGEVVQRPASAVKELLENAIDAGAESVILNIQDAGKALIQVKDDGRGMSEIDARLCIERHATSKISKVDDIFHIVTMGFRGEALASISAVSQFELKTKTEGSELACVIKMNGSTLESQNLEAGNTGTTITVRNLFFNVPARRNFLKSSSVENRHIIEVFQQVSLGNPEVAFSLINNGEEVYKLDKSNFKQRIVQLFGKRYNERLVPIKEETDIVSFSGFITKPEYATSKKGEQFFFVNKRFIKSPYLHHAVMTAYQDLLGKEMHPAYFIHLEIDPAQIDINIHPTKTEIKFLEERSIYAILRTCIRQSLGKFNISPSLDFERETAFDSLKPDRNKAISMPQIKVDKQYDPFKSTSRLIQSPQGFNSKKDNEAVKLYDVKIPQIIEQNVAATIETKLSDLEGETENSKSSIIQLHNKFILTHLKNGFMIIDQHRAHQRILYDKFILSGKTSFSSQKLLFPVLIELDKSDYALVKELHGNFEKIGFSIEEFGKDSISINGIPPGMDEKRTKEIFTSVLEDYKVSGQKKNDVGMDKISAILASNMAIKSGQKLHEKEMESIIDQLFASEMPYALPNGKPIVITISLEDLAKKFQY